MNEFIFRDKNDYSSILLNNNYNRLQMNPEIDTLFSCMIDYVSLLSNEEYNQCLSYINEQRTLKIKEQTQLKIQQILHEAQTKLNELDPTIVLTITTNTTEVKTEPILAEDTNEDTAEVKTEPLLDEDSNEDTDEEHRELTNEELIQWFECGDKQLLQRRIWNNDRLYEKYLTLKEVMNLINGNNQSPINSPIIRPISPPNESIEIDVSNSFSCVDCNELCEYHPRGKTIDTRLICKNKQCPSKKKITKKINNNNIPTHMEEEIKKFKNQIQYILDYVSSNDIEQIDKNPIKLDTTIDIVKNIRNIARKYISKHSKNWRLTTDDIPYIIKRILPYFLITHTPIKFNHLGNIEKYFTIKNDRVYYQNMVIDNKLARGYIKFLMENRMFNDYNVGSFSRDMIPIMRIVLEWDEEFYKNVKHINIGELVYKSI